MAQASMFEKAVEKIQQQVNRDNALATELLRFEAKMIPDGKGKQQPIALVISSLLSQVSSLLGDVIKQEQERVETAQGILLGQQVTPLEDINGTEAMPRSDVMADIRDFVEKDNPALMQDTQGIPRVQP